MLVGLGGAVLLVAPDVWAHGVGHNLLKGFLVLQLGCACWSGGSIVQRRQPARAHPVVSGAVQQVYYRPGEMVQICGSSTPPRIP